MEKKKNGETWGSNPVIEAGPVALDPYCGLAAALLKRTAKEAQAGDLGAVEWLLGDLAAWLADLLELDAVGMQRVASQWLVSNCFLVLEVYERRDGEDHLAEIVDIRTGESIKKHQVAPGSGNV